MKTMEMLIGIPYCGKSKYAEIRKDDNDRIHILHYLDTDNIDDVIQKINIEFSDNDYVILDGLNLERSSREKIIRGVREKYDLCVTGMVFAIPWITCCRRMQESNEIHEKDKDGYEPAYYSEQFEPPFYSEGFDDINIMTNSYTEGWETVDDILSKRGTLIRNGFGKLEPNPLYMSYLESMNSIKNTKYYNEHIINILKRAIVCYDNISPYDYLCGEMNMATIDKIFISNILSNKTKINNIRFNMDMRSYDFVASCASIVRELIGHIL